MDIETDTKITIEEAAHSLGVSTKTVQRYLASGILSKFKINHRTYLLTSEVSALAEKKRHGHASEPDETAPRTSPGDIVTVSRERYERLLIELGELRKEREYLLAAEMKRQELELALESAEADLAEARKLLEKGRTSRAESRNRTPDNITSPLDRGSEGRPPSQKPWWQK